jgi:hypothetical protein
MKLTKCAIVCADENLSNYYYEELTSKDIFCYRKDSFTNLYRFDVLHSPDFYFVDFGCVILKGLPLLLMMKGLRNYNVSSKVKIHRPIYLVGLGAPNVLFPFVDRWVETVHDI